MEIQINYCSVWNYEPRAVGLAEKIRDELGITAQVIPGSKGVYDIVVDGNIIYSKHQTKQFPDNDEIIKLIKQ